MTKTIPINYLCKKNRKQQWYIISFSIILSLFYSTYTVANYSKVPIRRGTSHRTTFQDTPVEGKITDKDTGQPLPGASIKIKGTSAGAVTDAAGHFSLNTPPDGILIINSLGYKSIEVPVNKRTIINLSLESSAKNLEEVVVNVGYTSQKKRLLTSAVSTLNTKDLNNIPTANISNSLAGRVAGVLAAQSSGAVGADGGEIHIRGVGTTGNSAALVIVDGVPRDLSTINPNMIASFTVLKDAAAVAPYGIAGANGVILVTTKRGIIGIPTLSYSGNTSWGNPTKLPSLLNAYQYATMRNIADKAAGNPLPYTEADLAGYQKTVDGAPDADPDKYPNTNAFDALINRNVPVMQHNLQIQGGTEATQYYIGGGYLYQEGLFGREKMNRYSLVANLDTRVTKTTKVSLSINGYNSVRNRPQSVDGAPFSTAQSYLPVSPVYFSNGLLGNSNGKLLKTGVELGSYKDNNTLIRTQLAIEQELPFVEGLSAKFAVSYDPAHNFVKNWSEPDPTYYNINTSTTPYSYNAVASTGKPALGESYSRSINLDYQTYLNYHRTFGKHDLTGLLVMDARTSHSDNFGASRSNYDLNIDELSLGSPNKNNFDNSGGSGDSRQVGYLYQVNYAFNNKYLFGATGRYDGSYVFGPGHRYGFFPAFSLGWRISEEPFIKKNFSWISNLKIRGSYGESGNLVAADQWSSSFDIFGNAYVINGTAVQGANERSEPNPNITWERAKKADIGLEASLWNGLLGFEIDYFFEKRDNMLVSPNSTVPQEYGIGISQINAGKMNNHGIDVTLSSYHQFDNGFRIDFSGTFTYAKNKLVQTFENQTTLNDPVRSRTGRSLNTIFSLHSLGLFQVSDDKNGDGIITAADGFPTQFGVITPGDIRYQDTNGDGRVDASDEVVVANGNSTFPAIQFGLNPRFSFKGFDLNVLFQGAAKAAVNLNGELVWPFFTGANSSTVTMDYWTPDNPDAKFPRLFGQGGTTNNTQVSDFFVRDLSYLRIKSLEFGYTLPESVLKKIKTQAIRIYISGTNLKTWDHLDGLVDPEMTNAGAGNSSNANQRGWAYPFMKTFAIGASVTF